MNILYIHTHDSGRCLSPYGQAVDTPNLQKLANEGVTFRQAFCANPTCSPSRAAMLTGQYAHSCKMYGLSHRGFSMHDHSHHISSYLSAMGFETTLSGFQHEAETYELGYDRVIYAETYHRKGMDFDAHDYAAAKAAVDYLHEKTSGGKPFFLSVGFMNTHRPYPSAAPDINPAHLLPPFGIPDTAEHRKEMASVITALRVVDRCVGSILNALEESGLDRNTLVFFTTDHGLAYPRQKCTVYDSGIGVALIMRVPGMKQAGTAIDALVSQVDIFPTLCDFANIPMPDWLEGVSLRPLLEGSTPSVRDHVFAEVNYHAAYEPIRCVRTDRYKYIRYYDDSQAAPVPANIDDGISKSYAVASGYLNQSVPREQLYDLALDPHENINRIDDPSLADVADSLKAALQQWQLDTDDPILVDGKIPLPKGALVNVITAKSASEKDFIQG